MTGDVPNFQWAIAVRRGLEPPAEGDVLTIEAWDGTDSVEQEILGGAGRVDVEWFEFGDLRLVASLGNPSEIRLQIRASTMAGDAAFVVDDVFLACTGMGRRWRRCRRAR